MKENSNNPFKHSEEVVMTDSSRIGQTSISRKIISFMEKSNLAVLGLLFMIGWLVLSIKSGDPIHREALPAYLIVCVLLFIRAIEKKY